MARGRSTALAPPTASITCRHTARGMRRAHTPVRARTLAHTATAAWNVGTGTISIRGRSSPRLGREYGYKGREDLNRWTFLSRTDQTQSGGLGASLSSLGLAISGAARWHRLLDKRAITDGVITDYFSILPSDIVVSPPGIFFLSSTILYERNGRGEDSYILTLWTGPSIEIDG